MKKKRYKYIHKVKNVIKDNIKIVIGVIIGITWTSGVAYAATIYYASANVSYDNGTSGLTSTTVQGALDELKTASDNYQASLTAAHPVGSIFMSTTLSSTSAVASALGGTWCAISQGRVLIGAGTNGNYKFTAGSTGGSTTAGNISTAEPSSILENPLGEYTHKLVVNELAKHRHSIPVPLAWGYSSGGGSGTWIISGSEPYTSYAGNDYYHNNIQPYLVVYMYKRVSDNASC